MAEPDDPKLEPADEKIVGRSEITEPSSAAESAPPWDQTMQPSRDADGDLQSTFDTDSKLKREFGVGSNSNQVRGDGISPADGNPKSPTLASLNSLLWDGQHSGTPEKLGRYLLLEKLGAGTYGVVHRARDEGLGRFVALKLLTRFEKQSEVDSWMSEARVLASLDHPAIVPVYDIGKTATGQPYIVSKLISGGALNKRFSRGGCSVEEAVKVVMQLADALDYLHRKGVMHRDIKPGNILTTSEGDAILADFGLALDETGYGKGARFVGTPAYMSPEQARSEGHRVDGRSDIYSLGVVFYELLTGTRPFKANNQDDLLDCIRNVEVRPLRQLNPNVPRELERICLRALAKKISDRYSTAGDLATDLLSWKNSPSVQSTVSLSASPASGVIEPIDPKSSQRSLDLGNIAVVPHGLRPFDSGDSDFFNFLLPGARDRHGTPDCVTFWTNRITNRNPTETFRVGVLLGPSGSGKSSMIRAGVLPLVKNEVQSIYVEAKPELLEANLMKQLQHALPSRLVGNSLRETLILFRQHNREQPGKKLVLVIDQFEQWLNHHREDETTELHDALRQCDGEHIQAILLVRDDFMLGLTQFMDQIEEFLLQNQNFATVEPFGVLHAKKVLSAFGRAYGAIGDSPTHDQEAFLSEAVGELASAGRLAPVQLAVLSEMIKDKPWTIATLKNLGGIEGLGVAFLEDRLAGTSAHPQMRAELMVVRRILGEMLPMDDTVIKPPACSQSVLMERLSGIATEETIRRLLNLLDTEVRLITPTSNANLANSGMGSTAGSTASDPAYQLTHDYLVPTIRKWLESLDAGTRAGRVRQQLREMAVVWDAKPTVKRLPSLIEWSAMRWFVKPREWTNAERRMIRATEWRLGKLTALVCGIACVLGTIGWLTMREIRSQSLADRLLEADTGNVADVLQAVQPYKSMVLWHLGQVDLNAYEPQTAARRKLHIALANFDVDAEQANIVLDGLDAIEDRHIGSVLGYIRNCQSLDNEAIVEKLRSSIQANKANMLGLAALLAEREPQHAVWPDVAKAVVEQLLRKRGVQLAFWPELLMPVKEFLLPVLVNAIETTAPTNTNEFENHLSLVSAFAKDDASTIARVAGYCNPERLPSFLQINATPVQLSVELREQLAIVTDANRESNSQKRNAEAIRVLEPLNGQLTPNGAWAAQIPWQKINGTLDEMHRHGYGPIAIRPYRVGVDLYGAVTWTKQPDEFIFESKLTPEALDARFKELQQEGAVMVDFARYFGEQNSSDTTQLWCGLWRKTSQGNVGFSQILELGELDDQDDDKGTTEGFVQSRVLNYCNAAGEQIQATLWNRSEQNSPSLDWSRMERAAGDLFPGYCATDLRVLTTTGSCERGLNWTNYLTFVEQIRGRKPTARETVMIATHLSASGKLEDALKKLLGLTEAEFLKLDEDERPSVQRGAQRQMARALARLGRLDELKKLLDESIIPGEFTQAEKDYLQLRLAVLSKDQSLVQSLLDDLEKVSGQSNYTDDYYLRALATVASSDFADGVSEAALDKLLKKAPLSIEKYPVVQATLLDVDFDGLRGNKAWQGLLDELKLSRRISSSAAVNNDRMHRFVLAQPLPEHNRSILKLIEEGYNPECINIEADSRGNLLATSLWNRVIRSNPELADDARHIAALTMSLARIGELDGVRDGLNEKWGRSVQSALIAHASKALSADLFVPLLRESSSNSLQAAIVTTLGNFAPNQLTEESRRFVSARLREWATGATDAGLLNASRWCLNQWNLEINEPLSKPTISKDRNWFTTALGQQMIVLQPPPFVMAGFNSINQQWYRVDRRLAIAANEVTGAEYAEFLKDPRVMDWIDRDPAKRNVRSVSDRLPQIASWDHAILFCQWLNEREGIPESEWCYKGVWSENEKIIPHGDYLSRTGYRLPTLAEFEWASSAGSEETWHFGSDAMVVSQYEWTMPHSGGASQPVASRCPNRLGLFDTCGNLAEWADNVSIDPLRDPFRSFDIDSGNKEVTTEKNRLLYGGRFKFSVQSAAVRTSVLEPSDYVSSSTGFRLARTIRD